MLLSAALQPALSMRIIPGSAYQAAGFAGVCGHHGSQHRVSLIRRRPAAPAILVLWLDLELPGAVALERPAQYLPAEVIIVGQDDVARLDACSARAPDLADNIGILVIKPGGGLTGEPIQRPAHLTQPVGHWFACPTGINADLLCLQSVIAFEARGDGNDLPTRGHLAGLDPFFNDGYFVALAEGIHVFVPTAGDVHERVQVINAGLMIWWIVDAGVVFPQA